MNKHIYHGGCHCQNIRFEINLALALDETIVTQCNCSICAMTAYLHLIIPKKQFKLTSNWANLNNYQFHTKVAKHYFCNICGIKSFYQPRSHPDCWSVNVRCLDDFDKLNLKVKTFDGKHWQKNIHQL